MKKPFYIMIEPTNGEVPFIHPSRFEAYEDAEGQALYLSSADNNCVILEAIERFKDSSKWKSIDGSITYIKQGTSNKI